MATRRQTQRGPIPPVLLVAVLLYVVSWLVPVYQGQELFGAMDGFAQLGAGPDPAASALSGPDWLPGWSACRVAWNLLTGQETPGGDDGQRLVLGATCLTNLVMLAALLALAWRKRPRVLGMLLLGCAALDTSWLWLGDEELRQALRAGYYLWAGSFVLAGIGLVLPAGNRTPSHRSSGRRRPSRRGWRPP